MAVRPFVAAVQGSDNPDNCPVKQEWVRQLDFSTLEKVSGSYVTDELRDREGDVIWRVRWGESWLYVYLLLEFQSTVDKYMAVRVMSYLGLLYHDLIRQKNLTPNGKLPPVLPLVPYNGEKRSLPYVMELGSV